MNPYDLLNIKEESVDREILLKEFKILTDSMNVIVKEKSLSYNNAAMKNSLFMMFIDLSRKFNRAKSTFNSNNLIRIDNKNIVNRVEFGKVYNDEKVAENVVSKEYLKDLENTFVDLANYSIMSLILIRSRIIEFLIEGQYCDVKNVHDCVKLRCIKEDENEIEKLAE